jgi:hypothetical protein
VGEGWVRALFWNLDVFSGLQSVIKSTDRATLRPPHPTLSPEGARAKKVEALSLWERVG